MKSQTVRVEEMETTKENNDFGSFRDSIVMSITTKLKEIEAKVKQLGLKEEELERRSKELVERSTVLESDEEKLALRETQYEKKRRELEIHAVEIEEERDRVAEQLRELELKDVQFKLREEAIELRSRDNERRRIELDRILEKFEADEKKLEERSREIDQKEKQIEGSINGLDILSKDLERQRRELDERMHEVVQKERQLDEKFKVFESSQRRLDTDWKNLDFRIREVSNRERKLDRGLEQLKLEENSFDMKSKENEFKRNCKEIVLDGKTLQIFLNECCQNHEKMGDEVSFLLRLSKDPAKLVLDALEGFFPPYLRKNGNGEEFNGHIVQKSCILLLEQLLKISPPIKITPEVNNEARKLSCVWITKLKLDSEHSMEILGFLLVLAVYNVVSVFSLDEIFNYVKIVAGFEQVPELCCLLGLTDKISGLIQDLIERKQHLLAIKYAFNYNLIEKFPLDSLLKDHIETSKIESAAIIKSGNNSRMTQSRAKTRTISDLTAAIACIEKYNISSEYSPANLRQMIASLSNKHDEVEQKEAVVHAPAASAVAESPQLQQTSTCSSVHVSSIEPKVVVSTEGNASDHVWTDPLPKRRKLLDGQSISMEHEHVKPEKQVCGSEKDIGFLIRQNLDFCSMRVKVVGILQSSSNPAGLVLDAMRLCFLPICRGAREEIPMKWCISLLKELRGHSIDYCFCEEAKKLVISWKKILIGKQSCDPMEIACFLLCFDVYKLCFTMKETLVVPPITLLECPKLLHQVFREIGFPEFLPGMIMIWIGMNHRIQAIRYIHALQLGGMFPVANLINEHLQYWNKLGDERYKTPNSPASLTLKYINHRLHGVNNVLALVRDCKLESEYPIKQLEESRNELVIRQEFTKKLSNLQQQQQQQQKKRGKFHKLETRLCFNCGKKGHLASVCKKPPQNQDQYIA